MHIPTIAWYKINMTQPYLKATSVHISLIECITNIYVKNHCIITIIQETDIKHVSCSF